MSVASCVTTHLRTVLRQKNEDEPSYTGFRVASVDLDRWPDRVCELPRWLDWRGAPYSQALDGEAGRIYSLFLDAEKAVRWPRVQRL